MAGRGVRGREGPQEGRPRLLIGPPPPMDLVRQSHLSPDGGREGGRKGWPSGFITALTSRLRTWQKLTAPPCWPAPPAWCWGSGGGIKAPGRRDKMSFGLTTVINTKGWGRGGDEWVRGRGSHAGVIRRWGEERIYDWDSSLNFVPARSESFIDRWTDMWWFSLWTFEIDRKKCVWYYSQSFFFQIIALHCHQTIASCELQETWVKMEWMKIMIC